MKFFCTIIITALCISVLSAQAELPSKNLIAGGSINFSMDNNDSPFSIVYLDGSIGTIGSSSLRDRSRTIFRFFPYFGKEVSSRWLLGIQLRYSLERFTSNVSLPDISGQLDTFNLKQKDIGYGIGLFGRYTFNPENKVEVFLQPSVNFTFLDEQNLNNEIVTGEAESYSFGIGSSLGILYEISDHFSLTSRFGAIGFETGKWTNNETDESQNFNSFSTTLNLSSLFFGFEYKF